jgi:hypothetical protein
LTAEPALTTFVHDRDPASADDLPQRIGQPVADGEKGGAIAVVEALRVDERHLEPLGDEQRDVGALHEWSAHHLRRHGPQSLRERVGERPDPAGVEEQELQVEPLRAVVTGLEAEVPLAGREQLRRLDGGVHRRTLVAVGRVWYFL